MFTKWLYSVLIFSLTVLGVVSQQQFKVANQEIVLQFQNANLSAQQTEHTIATIKQQLEDLGAKNIKVRAQGFSKLKISYYSSINVTRIKETLLNPTTLKLQDLAINKNTKRLPFEDTQVSYNIDVFEIQENTSAGWDLDGAITLVLDVKSDRFLSSNSLSVGSLSYAYQDGITLVAYKIAKDIAIHISDALHTIPEVRAGPNC